MRGNHKLIAFLALLAVFVVVIVLAAAFEHDEMTLRLMDAAVVALVGVIGGAGQAIFRYSQGEAAAPQRARDAAAQESAVPERPSWQA